jgi:protein-tyrosine phosphatase
MDVVPEVPTERTAIVVWLLAKGRCMKTSEVADLTGVTRQGAYEIMVRISRVLPIYQADEIWKATTPE